MEYTKDLFEKLRPDVSVATSGRICCYVGTHLLLYRDVGNATSGRNFCCIVGGFSIKITLKSAE